MGNNMISLGGLLITLLVASYGATAAENFKLHGALVTEPCSLEAGDENIELDFGSVVDKIPVSAPAHQQQIFHPAPDGLRYQPG